MSEEVSMTNPNEDNMSQCEHIDTLGRCKCDRCGLPVEMWEKKCNMSQDENEKMADDALKGLDWAINGEYEGSGEAIERVILKALQAKDTHCQAKIEELEREADKHKEAAAHFEMELFTARNRIQELEKELEEIHLKLNQLCLGAGTASEKFSRYVKRVSVQEKEESK